MLKSKSGFQLTAALVGGVLLSACAGLPPAAELQSESVPVTYACRTGSAIKYKVPQGWPPERLWKGGSCAFQ